MHKRVFACVPIYWHSSQRFLLQPTVHFAEEPIIRGGDEDEEEDGEDGGRSDEEDERPCFPAEKQRLIRKDTPHYKKHFKITKLPKPEAVAALLQGFSPDGLHSPTQNAEDDEEDEEEEDCVGSPHHYHRLEAPELEDSRHQVNASQVKVKEGWWRGQLEQRGAGR